MKKFLLSLAAIAMAATASAASYTVFDIENPGEWNGSANGWTSTVVVNGKTFTLTTDKAESTTDLISPVANTYAWRVYKKSQFTIASNDVTMKQIIITYDDYNDGYYCLELVLSSGWTGSLDGATYTLVSDGQKSFTGTSDKGQVRIKKIVVSDEAGEIPNDPGQDLPDGVVYQNTFEENMDGWVKINDESLSDFSGWKINSNPKCAICNSYYGGAPHAADSKMQYTVDLTDYEDCSFNFEMGFGYDFPQAQNEDYRVYVISNDVTSYFTMTTYPAAPESGNWTKNWAKNEFDLSEFDGTKITLGFQYKNDGSKSGAWEVKNFEVKGSKAGAVNEISADSNAAPVYYNLQGVRVNNPENGIFIVVKGNKSQKVVF